MASTIVASNTIVLEPLNRHNYRDWSSRLRTYLLAKDLWGVVIEDPPEVRKGEAILAWRIKNAKALHVIKISCGIEIFSFIREMETAKRAWNLLEKKCISVDRGFQNVVIDPVLEQHPLHKAAMQGHVHKMKDLLPSMKEEDLFRRDSQGRTALEVTIVASFSEEVAIRMARCMVEKNRDIVHISSRPYNLLPVVRACSERKWKMARYLYSVTRPGALMEQNGTAGAGLITNCIKHSQGIDMAWNLLQRRPILALAGSLFGQNPMLELAGMRYAFLSGARLTLWQKLIYKRIDVPPLALNVSEIHIDVSESEDELRQIKKSEDDQGNRRDLFCSGINHVYEVKSNHVQFNQLLCCMGDVANSMDNFTEPQLRVVRHSVFKAVECGNVEFVTRMRRANPAIMNILNDENMNIIQYAIKCRREEIYNLMYVLEVERRDEIRDSAAKMGNNLLHIAAELSPHAQINHIQGASLQMQRERLWFKEVESILPVGKQKLLNYSGLTGRELFTKSHKNLKEEAEISMKGTATSCTTIGALIVTIMFAVAFTVPGGTNGNTGLPMFMHKKLFKVFIVSDTISLVFSTTAVITFLGLLTSRYEEDDFLWSLPTKMMIGLSTLFISIAAMMITFSCALTIMLDGEAKIIIPSIAFASAPVISFVYFLFPLLIEICRSTYGPAIFDRKDSLWY